MFFDIMNIAKLNVYPTSKVEKDVNGDSVEMWGIMFSDPNLKTFLSDWQRMRGLYISGAIDQDLYLIWLEREVKKYNFSIVPELEIPMHSPIENDDCSHQQDE